VRYSLIRALTLAGVIAAASAALHADTIYSDFGDGGSYDPDAGDVVSASVDLRPSFAFSTAVDMVLTEVDFVTSIGVSTDVNQVTVSLSSDAGGHPGTLLASQEFDNAMGILGGETDDPPDGPQILSWLPSTPLDLLAGVTYWITFDGPAPGDVTWNYNNMLQSGYSEIVSGDWQATNGTLGAIQISGDIANQDPAAPEPRTILLLGLGLIAMSRLKRRN
jgi:hypothetical protein